MMKIQVSEHDDRMVLQVEGRLAGAFVLELETCWHAARRGRPDEKISVDLQGVTCIDRSGRYLLQLMHTKGVALVRKGLAVQEILEQEQQQCQH
jgi:anti-anti-sigma regulatory factor